MTCRCGPVTRPVGPSRPSHIASAYGIAGAHELLAAMQMGSDEPLAVIEVDDVAAKGEAIDQAHDAAIGGAKQAAGPRYFRLPGEACQVDATILRQRVGRQGPYR